MAGSQFSILCGEGTRPPYGVCHANHVNHVTNVVHAYDVSTQKHCGSNRRSRRHVSFLRWPFADRGGQERLARRSGQQRKPQRCQSRQRGKGFEAVLRSLREAEPRVEDDRFTSDTCRHRALETRAQLILHFVRHRGIGRLAVHITGATAGMHKNQTGTGTCGDSCESRIISQAGHVVDQRRAFKERDLCNRNLRRID